MLLIAFVINSYCLALNQIISCLLMYPKVITISFSFSLSLCFPPPGFEIVNKLFDKFICLTIVRCVFNLMMMICACDFGLCNMKWCICAVYAILINFESRHNDTPVVRASGRELSYVLLAGIIMCYSVTFALVLRPTDITCGIQR